MKVIAHRGNSAQYPENTLAAFESAVELDVDMIEFDVRMSCDGEVVVIHDDSVDRTTSGAGKVGALTVAELRSLGVPTLAELLALPVGLNIEIKERRVTPRVMELIRGRGDIVVSSFDWLALDEARQINPGQALGYLCRAFNCEQGITRAAAADAASVNCPCAAVELGLVTAAHDAGLEILVYTVNDIAEGRLIETMGVDGIFTDEPAVMLDAFGGR
ncbi:MAG: hypothetical protein JOZ39_04765 [Chloroflexi bacterium]|nr:hypothetical protein [Chloroflexota bacterium]